MSLEALQSWISKAVLSDLPTSRRYSYLFFSLALFVALGSQCFINPVRLAVFLDVVGVQHEPLARTLCMVVLVPCLLFYGVIVSNVSSPARLVAVICGVYALVFLAIAVTLLLAGGEPEAWVAWTLYYAVETKAVVVMPMVWSAIAEVSTPDLAKKAYPILFFAPQVGGILGALVAIKVDSLGGEVELLFFQVLCLLLIMAFTGFACRFADPAVDEETPLLQSQVFAQAQPLEAGHDAKVPPSSKVDKVAAPSPWQAGLQELFNGFEGLWLLVSRPYVFMAFWVSYASMVPRTILDYQNQVLVVGALEKRNEEIAYFGQISLLINCGTAVLTLVGTRPLVEYFGVDSCLLVLPVVMLLAVLALCLNYTLATSVISLVLSCIVAYGLNSPCKEILYVRTTREIKFKAKSWSEMYGNQAMKLLGAQVNLWANRERASCEPFCFNVPVTLTVVALWVLVWFKVACRLGVEYRHLEDAEKLVH